MPPNTAGSSNSSSSAKSQTNQSVKKQFMGLRGKNLNRGIAFIAGMGFLLFGYDQGVMGSLLTLPSFTNAFPTIDTGRHPENSTLQGFTIAVYEIGCLIGAIVAMLGFGDYIGRRKMIFYGAIIMAIGAILQTTAFTVAHLIVARIVTGVGNGFITSTVPMWQSECAKAEKRGALVMMQGALITGGIMISYWVDFGFYFAKGEVSFRFPIAFQTVFALVLIAFVLPLPESPRWLCKQGKKEEAAAVFAALDDTEIEDPSVKEQVDEIIEALALERESGADSTSLRQLFEFGKTKTFHRAMLAFFSQVMQQITGINLITYYAGTIFEKYIGMSPLNSRILAACNGTEYFIASWISFFTIETIGRRKLMLFGAIGQSFSMAILTGTTWASDKNGDSKAAIAAAVMLFVFNSFFAVGYLGNTWLYPAEISPLRCRSQINGLSTAGNWAFNFMVVMITPIAFENIGSYTYTIFAVINLVMFPVVYVFYPETAGRSLEEMDKLFELSNPRTPWDVVRIAQELPFDHAGRHNKGQDEEKARYSHESAPN